MPPETPNNQIRPRTKPYDRIPDPNNPITIKHYDPKKGGYSESPSIPTAQPIQIEHSGDNQGFSGQPPSITTIPADLVGPSSNAEAGPADFEEDVSYYDFRDGFDNPVAVQRLAKIADTMTGLTVATQIAEHGRYETISDLSKDLNTGQGIKAEDVETTKRALKKLVSILKRGMKEKDMKTKAVSFSKVLASDCLRMGLDIKSTPMPTTVANQKILDCLSKFFEFSLPKFSTTIQDEFNKPSTVSGLAATIARISRGANDDLEAFSRRISDLFVVLMHETFEKLHLAFYDIVEFRIASAEDPVEILRDGFRTILTGSTDYAFFLQAGGWSTTDLEEFCDKHKSSGIKALLHRIKFNNVQILLFEIKSKEYSQSLVTCLPQIGAECIATLNATTQKEMAWCLSTGSTWIFGTIQLNEDGTYVMRMTEPMKFELRNANKNSNFGIIHCIFRALICWTLVPANEVIEKVFGNEESKT